MSNAFRYAALSVVTAALLLFSGFYFFGGSTTEAGPPAFWITIDETELEHIQRAGLAIGSDGQSQVIERSGGLAIVKVDELQIAELSAKMHEEFHKCAGFMTHFSMEEASRAIDEHLAASTITQFVEYTIDNQAAVTPMIAEAAEPNIRQTIIDLSSLHTRRHDQQGGIDGANMILTKWRQIALGRTDISVQPYAHLNANGDFITPQPSIIMTIQGTEFPNEIVVVGGHQDSILSGSSTGNAPGADDDASGISSITEAIRVIKETGFRPKRTIQFMAYAAEEVGLVGSKNIAENYRNQNKNVVGVLQLDMTNYGGSWADIVLMTDHTNAAQNLFVKDLAAEYLPNLVVKDDLCGYGCSDHASWHAKNYPASMPFEAKFSGTTLDGIPRQYNTALHTTNDTITRSNSNADHALKFTKLAISFVGELAKGSVETTTVPQTTRFDFDGDGRADLSVFRPEGGIWHLNQSQAGYTVTQFGISTDRIVPADFDGDGRTDIAVYRDGIWHLLRTQLGYTSVLWGIATDIPQAQDFDGDGKADLAVFRPSEGVWYIQQSTGGNSIFPFGMAGDRPVASDFDGDGKADAAVYRNGIWHVLGSTDGYAAFQFGIDTDLPLTGDFDGDGRNDATVFRDGIWYTLKSTGGYSIFQWGLPNDLPTAADYDGDGKADIAIYREGVWYIFKSSDGTYLIEQFGISTDIPAASAFLN